MDRTLKTFLPFGYFSFLLAPKGCSSFVRASIVKVVTVWNRIFDIQRRKLSYDVSMNLSNAERQGRPRLNAAASSKKKTDGPPRVLLMRYKLSNHGCGLLDCCCQTFVERWLNSNESTQPESCGRKKGFGQRQKQKYIPFTSRYVLRISYCCDVKIGLGSICEPCARSKPPQRCNTNRERICRLELKHNQSAKRRGKTHQCEDLPAFRGTQWLFEQGSGSNFRWYYHPLRVRLEIRRSMMAEEMKVGRFYLQLRTTME